MDIAPGRVAAYGIENHAGTPVYVHAKVCVIDDTWASTGSRQLQPPLVDARLRAQRRRPRRGLRPRPPAHARRRAPRPRSTRSPSAGLLEVMADCVDPAGMYAAYADAAARLEEWHRGGRVGTDRPAGCVRSRCRGCRASPGRGRASRSRCCTTPTGGRARSAGPRSTDGPARRVRRSQVLSTADPRSLSAVRERLQRGTDGAHRRHRRVRDGRVERGRERRGSESTASSCALNSLLAELLTCAKSCSTAANLVCSS